MGVFFGPRRLGSWKGRKLERIQESPVDVSHVQRRVIQTKVQTMKNSTQNVPVDSLLLNSADRFYPALSALVIHQEGRSDAPVAPVTASQSDTWWGRSYNQGLPAVGGRYAFLRGAWLPGNPCDSWDASASWGACAPSTGEAC